MVHEKEPSCALMRSQRVRFRVPAGCQRSNANNGRGAYSKTPDTQGVMTVVSYHT
jgi:hypothetical protein